MVCAFVPLCNALYVVYYMLHSLKLGFVSSVGTYDDEKWLSNAILFSIIGLPRYDVPRFVSYVVAIARYQNIYFHYKLNNSKRCTE